MKNYVSFKNCQITISIVAKNNFFAYLDNGKMEKMKVHEIVGNFSGWRKKPKTNLRLENRRKLEKSFSN